MKKSNSLIYVALFAVLFLAIAAYTLPIMMGIYIAGELGGSNDIATYVVTFYAIGNAIGIPLGGALKDRIGPARFLVYCLLSFAFFTFLCAAAPTYFLFNFFRLLQGISSGPIYALVFYFFGQFVPKEKKEQFNIIIITLFSVVPVAAACYGGWIAYDYHWSNSFYFDAPFLVVLAGFFWFKLREKKEHLKKVPFDGTGYFFYCVGILCISTAIITGQQLDWFRSPLICFLFAFGVASFGFFILWDLKSSHPILHLKLLVKNTLGFALFFLAVLFGAYFGMIILLSLWLSLDVNYTPTWIALLLGTMALTGLCPVFLVKKKHIDPRYMLGIAVIFFAISCFHTTTFDVDIDFQRIAFSRVIAGLGLAFFLPPLFRLAFGGFSEEEEVPVLTLFQAARALGSGIGVAIFSTLWQRRQVFFHSRMGGDLTLFDPSTREFFINAKQFQLKGLPAADQLNTYLDRRSLSLALDDCFYLMGYIMVALFVLLLISKGREVFLSKKRA